ncbi:MAG: flagellar biosynthesis anti-sigma factor FlgM [Rhodoferax sp.]|nr:flagellar biosynthesis anti-sigma factor FlgM [Rhodoferax sp.]NCP55357.1 flagellar biosynthesis anti-sigma factor FlgM [Rhodoferax sp.]PIW09956.1 MAG: flagellar biosynthesis anti-sigma factor FlgM [Comamonadaceae bacterium CG17_big_fil_post_rev_8_21_14_2_50_60_13]PIY25106.1 MAG: flagellar biosynthesis anti-sigma factor FlgM [Comamonadaceae bacterium CG_4_10_14_3_um_filter_60_75]PJC14195.1 MAG: flagellar biosynthesis anti-sigma factor FlgM [Comamonadaceae bacterium CG_4_9_14_0_8_um_filter_60_
MKINLPADKPVLPSNNAASVSAKNAPTVSAQSSSTAAKSTQSAGVAVSVSTLVRALEANNAGEVPSVDGKKIETVRTAIAQGTYVVNPEAIADKLLANAEEMLQRTRV